MEKGPNRIAVATGQQQGQFMNAAWHSMSTPAAVLVLQIDAAAVEDIYDAAGSVGRRKRLTLEEAEALQQQQQRQQQQQQQGKQEVTK